MNGVSENGILSKEEFASYKQRVVRSRFFHQMFLGIGGATVFGLVGVLARGLLDAAVASGASALPVLGLIGIGVLGVGCLYLGARYLSQTVMLDQDFQAKKIGLAARGVEPAISAPGMTASTRSASLSTENTSATLDAQPQMTVHSGALQDRVVPLAATEKQAVPTAKDSLSFVERTAANDAGVDSRARA